MLFYAEAKLITFKAFWVIIELLDKRRCTNYLRYVSLSCICSQKKLKVFLIRYPNRKGGLGVSSVSADKGSVGGRSPVK